MLTLLPVYHRPYDAKLLMLAIPACAALWAAGGVQRWLAMACTLAGVLITTDIPLALLAAYTQTRVAGLAAEKSVLVLLLPPLFLLAMGCCYLLMFLARTSPARPKELAAGFQPVLLRCSDNASQ